MIRTFRGHYRAVVQLGHCDVTWCTSNPMVCPFGGIPCRGRQPVLRRSACRSHNLAYRIANGGEVMPAWKGVLSADEIWDLVNFIRAQRR